MIWKIACTLALLAKVASSYRDTSPFFMFSSSQLLTPSSKLITGPQLQKEILKQIETCPSDVYVLVSQPGVGADDYHDGEATKNLGGWMKGDGPNIRSTYVAQDVKGYFDPSKVMDTLSSRCNAEYIRQDPSTGSIAISDNPNPQVIELRFPFLPNGKDRMTALAEHDEILGRLVDLLPSQKFTVLYSTTPTRGGSQESLVEPDPYEMESVLHGHSHVELKRDLRVHKRQASNVTLPDGPLFERYQFLSPGLFMGLLAGFLLLTILYVAISGISSLQITYAAFDKEIGPAAQKNKVQ